MLDAPKPVIAIVDPISTGASLAKFLSNLGYPLVRVFSDTIPDEVKALVAEGLEVNWLVTIQHEIGPGRAAHTAAALRGLGVKNVIVGSEPGVSLQAELSSAFGQPVPADKIELRRNKYLQSEAVRDAGLDAVHQRLAHTREDVEGCLPSALPRAPTEVHTTKRDLASSRWQVRWHHRALWRGVQGGGPVLTCTLVITPLC